MNCFGVAHILVVGRVACIAEVASRAHGKAVTSDQAVGLQEAVGHASSADSGGGQSVVDLISGGDARDGQGLGGDGCRDTAPNY